MKIVKPNVEVFTPVNPLEHIEKCGRVCYKSESRITPGSSEKFCKSIIARGHEAVLEHYVFLFEVTTPLFNGLMYTIKQMETRLGFRSYIRATNDPETERCLISGSVRAWRDFMAGCLKMYNGLPGWLYTLAHDNPVLFPEYQDDGLYSKTTRVGTLTPVSADFLETDLEIQVHRNITLKFTCDRGVSHEIVRHRPASYCQESTRYCNYSSGDFGGEITVIEPVFMVPGSQPYNLWCLSCKMAETSYFGLLDIGCTPQEARSVLPNSLKTEVVMTANLQEWKHFFELRCSSAAHPQMREVANMARDLLEKEGVL